MDSRRKDRTPLTLTQVVAAVVSFRRLLVVCFIAPLIVAVSPMLVGLYLFIMDRITAGQGFVTTLLTASATLLGRGAILLYAPSAKQRDESLKDSRYALPVIGFLLSRIFISYILSPIAALFGVSGIITASPELPYVTALRLAACMVLLGVDILARFLGPVSIERCSSMPLRSHPMTSSIRNFVSRCFSLDAFLDLIASPSDKPGELLRPPTPSWRETGQRYHRPSIRASVGQLLISTFIGFVLAHMLPIGQDFASDPLGNLVVVATCVLTVLWNLVFSALDGTSHEIDPQFYQSLKPHQIISVSSISSLGGTFIMVSAVAVAMGYRSDGEEVEFISSMELFVVALIINVLVSIYLALINEASKFTLCVPGVDIEGLVEELSGDSPHETTLHVFVESIVEGSDNVVRYIFQPTQKEAAPHAEDDEIKRGDESMHRMAQVLLGMDLHPDSSQACLEGDMLRVSILESLGGTDDTEGAAKPELKKSSARHMEAIKKWVHPQKAVWGGVSRREPDAVPLLRALCAYSGGLGVSLQICTLPPNAPQRLALDGTSPLTTWSLPPGGRACAEWSITAAARLIVFSLTSAKEPVTDWRSSTLAVLVPTMLQAAFQLRKGVLRFGRMSHGKKTVTPKANAVELISENESLRSVVVACEQAAMMVVNAVRASAGMTRLNIKMSNECRLSA